MWKRQLIKGWQFRCLASNIHGNFQESDLLKFSEETANLLLYFNVQRVGRITVRTEEESFAVHFLIPQIVQYVQSFPEAFYLESPLYWKLKSASGVD